MKNKVFIAMTAAVAMAALTACGDSSGKAEPSKAESCSQKPITAECLNGTWDVVGIAKLTGESIADYSAGPGKLIMTKTEGKEEGKVEFDLPGSASKVNPLDYPVHGTWTVANGVVNFHIISTAIYGTRFEMVPTVKVEGAFVKLTFNRQLFLIPEVDDSPFDANTEVFSISAN